MRIISGKYGKRRFQVPRTFKARPTTDLAKEALFNVLENQIEWHHTRALDLFAGTGSIGFELLSRGAKEVVAVEMVQLHTNFIKEVATQLADPHYRLMRKDVLRLLREQTALPPEEKMQFDLIFADPPYQLPQLPQLPTLILESGMLAPQGTLIVEHPGTISFAQLPSFQELRHYGAVHFSFFHNSL